jgi:dTDP-4-amino-4,6-dideoxygalactose transaminase
MNEVSAAVLDVQLDKLDLILTTLRANKAALRSMLVDLPGVSFRHLADPDGDIATHLVVMLPSADTAKQVATELGTKTLADSGWHVYANMEHLIQKRVVSGHMAAMSDYVAYPGALPATDSILGRSITLGIGVVDPGIGSAFGLNVRSDSDDIDRVARQFSAAYRRHHTRSPI